MFEGEEALESDLIDLSGVELDQAASLPDSALAQALRRVFARSSDSVQGYYLGHDSSLPGD
ncbi:hypothetical protein [Nonomuraea sp. NPDC050540]|uniref:hypothetical protein n=1 Tax=Nonomuraea sp. NPDC050540 TaxID=3364367 RepID=UPI0037AD64F1